MGTEQFNIVLTGRVLPGRDPAEAANGLAGLLKVQQARAERLLAGRATRLKKAFLREKAESLMQALATVGVESRLQPIVPEPTRVGRREAEAPSPSKRGNGLAIQVRSMQCPRCGHEQPYAEVCRQCGVVIAKVVHNAPRRRSHDKPKVQSSFPYHLLNRLLQLFFLLSLAATVWSYTNKDRLPPADFYGQALLADPVQTETSVRPFSTEVNGIVYHIEPVADYELHGVVVSYHDSDAFIDIYHHKDWKDFINVRDICVIWGDNVTSEVYRDMEFKNTTWTCWAYWPNREIAHRFKMQELSNNHLLANNPRVHEAMMGAEPGDYISLKGVLASYSHSNGKFKRGTSTVRTDTGNGACETVFVENFRVVKKANTGWRGFYVLSGAIAVLSLIGIVVLLFVAPVRRH